MTTNTQSYPMASLYVGDLHHEATEAMLYEKFSQVTSTFFDDNSFSRTNSNGIHKTVL